MNIKDDFFFFVLFVMTFKWRMFEIVDSIDEYYKSKQQTNLLETIFIVQNN